MSTIWFAGPSSFHFPEGKPLPFVLLGEKYAIFQNTSGYHALSDVCPHRQASLSLGTVKGECLTCPYHGWQFAGNGEVKTVPAHPLQKIGSKFKADVAAISSSYGWTFIRPLESAQNLSSEASLELSEGAKQFFATPPGTFRSISGTFDWSANFSRVVANGIDFAHLPFVHADSFGNVDYEEVEKYQCIDFDGGASSRQIMVPPDNFQQKLFRLVVNRGKKNTVLGTVSFLIPNMTRLDLELGFGARMILIASHVPVSEKETRTYWVMHRNFAKLALLDAMFFKETLKIFAADQTIVESQTAMNSTDGQQITVASDALEMLYRKKMRQLG